MLLFPFCLYLIDKYTFHHQLAAVPLRNLNYKFITCEKKIKYITWITVQHHSHTNTAAGKVIDSVCPTSTLTEYINDCVSCLITFSSTKWLLFVCILYRSICKFQNGCDFKIETKQQQNMKKSPHLFSISQKQHHLHTYIYIYISTHLGTRIRTTYSLYEEKRL